MTIDLPPQLERRVQEEAAKQGCGASDYVRAVLEEKLAIASPAERLQDPYAGLQRATPEAVQAFLRAQGVKPIDRFDDLLGDFWPEDESVDDFLEARRRLQWEGAPPPRCS